MKSTVYEIREYRTEIRIRNRKDLAQLRPGCAFDDTDPELIASFDNEAAARKHLMSLESDVSIENGWAGGLYALVREYGLECNAVDIDEDGDIEYLSTEYVDF